MPRTEQKSTLKIVTHMLSGVLTALIITTLFLFLFAVIISSGGMDLDSAKQLAIAACAVGTLIGGAVAVRLCRKRALPVGAGVGAIYFVILLLLAPLFTDEVVYGACQLPLLFACLCAGALAGLMMGKKRKKRRL